MEVQKALCSTTLVSQKLLSRQLIREGVHREEIIKAQTWKRKIKDRIKILEGETKIYVYRAPKLLQE